MAVNDNRSLTLERRSRAPEGSRSSRGSAGRSRGMGLGPVGQRLSNLFRVTKDAGPGYDGQPTEAIDAVQWPEEQGWGDEQQQSEQERWPEEDVLPRFPFARNGYHCATVDAHVAELEQELAEIDRELVELRAYRNTKDDVSAEIKRIGEQTSAVLIAANEQRDEMLRAAREEAERCVADARAKAALITSEAEARLRELRAEHAAAERERGRLLEEVRNVSAALSALADAPNGRAPAVGEMAEAGL